MSLFKSITTYSSVSSVQLSNVSLNNILHFDPSAFKFQIPSINTRLSNLFVLATTRTRALDQNERIQHTLSAYSKILQPEVWAQWIRNKTDAFEDGLITNCQSFMNDAVKKLSLIHI